MIEKNVFFDYDVIYNNKVVKIMIGENKRWELFDILEFFVYLIVEYLVRVVIIKNLFIVIFDWKRECVIVLNLSGYI